MTQEQKSSRTTQKNKKEEKIPLLVAIDKLGITGTKRFAAQKLFKRSEEMTEKDWVRVFSVKRIIQK